MRFSLLADYFEKLEKTPSRLALIDILSDLFKQCSKSEVEKVIYLTQGRIAPFFEPLEIGMAEKTVAQAMALAYGSKKEEVLGLYTKLGDMGIVAVQLTQNPKSKLQDLSVTEVFNILVQIAKTKGTGTVERKQFLLSDLLKKLDPISAKHLVRIPLGNLRLGIGDPTILDALAKAKLGDRSKRKLLEGAYNRTSDLGLIAKTLFDKGLNEVEKLKVQVGKPIRSELCERLTTTDKVIEKMREVDAQYKYDGFRIQIHKNGKEVFMFSRNLENMTNMFPELIEGTIRQVKAKTAILDAEALAYNLESEEFLPFQETTKRRRKYGIEEMAQKLPLKAFVFDILYENGRSLIDEPLYKRLEILHGTIKENGILIPTKDQRVSDPKKLGLILDDAISKGLEGIVVKKLESKYEAGGRNFNWVKLKRHSAGELRDTIDCVVLGYISGKGKRTAFGAGALLAGLYDDKKDEFVTVSKIGTGLTDEEWREIKVQSSKFKVQAKPARVNSLITPSVWVEPKIVVEVLADEITRSPIHTAGKTGEEPGYALRFPRLVSFRGVDKKAEDATSVKELISMYHQQKR
ncbi:ATP-dependent DNA ligase [Patescibacteria group bacterium]|nr:ATP-dependent DNA ligase [Patescibacteria group bacterium]MCL5010027.1 ATP-dependent DNA ligase [Patescibacteria group bacterium]